MAKVKAPLLSLGATGQLGKTVVFSTWKGIKTGREYVKPSNPQTIAQVAQRAIITLVVAFWKSSQQVASIVTGWNVAASVSGKPQSGFNLFTSNAAKLAKDQGDVAAGTVYMFYFGTTATNLALLGSSTTASEKPAFFQSFGHIGGSLYAYGVELFDIAVEAQAAIVVASPGEGFYQVKAVVDSKTYDLTGIIAATPVL